MKIIENKYLPPKGFIAINLFGIVFCRDKSALTRIVKNHEQIHTVQMKELLYIFYFILYGLEWICKIPVYMNFHIAYRSISFEKEAYAKEKDLAYLSKRKKYAWVKYMFNK